MKNKVKHNEVFHLLTSSICNNRCIFCMDKNNIVNVDFEYLKKQINKKVNDCIAFTCNEPTLNENLLELIQQAKSKKYKQILLISNGRRLSYFDYCKSVIESGINELTISIHGYNKKIHEAIARAPGSFGQTIKALENIKILKKKHNFDLTINMTVVKQNYKYINNFVKYFKKYGPRVINFNTIEINKNVKGQFKNISVKYSDVLKVYLKAKKENNDINISLSGMPSCIREEGLYDKPIFFHKNKKTEKSFFANKHYGKPCMSCNLKGHCEGVYIGYTDIYGWEEFKDVHEK